jgi:hypothetical protein
MIEDEILARVSVDQALRRFSPEQAEMLKLIYAIDQPADWTFPWPPVYETIGRYLGQKYHGRDLRECTIRQRIRKLLPMSDRRRKRGVK